MKFHYRFSNLLGTVYRRGNLIFAPDGTTILSPVGNKLSVYDLKSHTSLTLPVESRSDFTTLALSPNGILLLAANAEGDPGRRGFSLLHHEKNHVRAPAGQRPISSDGSSPPAPNLTVRPFPSSSERPDIQLVLVSVSRFSTVSGGIVWAELD